MAVAVKQFYLHYRGYQLADEVKCTKTLKTIYRMVVLCPWTGITTTMA